MNHRRLFASTIPCLLFGLAAQANAAVRYEISELLPPANDSLSLTWSIADINDQGWVVGSCYDYVNGIERPTIWKDGQALTAWTMEDPNFQRLGAQAIAINESGQVIGPERYYSELGEDQSYNVLAGPSGNVVLCGIPHGDPALCNDDGGGGQLLSARAGSNPCVSAFGTGLSRVLGLNNLGTVVGQATISHSEPGHCETQYHAAMWVNGAVVDLEPGVPYGNWGELTDVNDAGVAVGSLDDNTLNRAVRWDNGWTDLGNLGGLRAAATAINNAGVIVGASTADQDGFNFFAFRWRDGQMAALETYGAESSTAADINDRGQIVGSVPAGAALWEGDSLLYLDDLIDPASGWQLLYPEAINNRGDIIGWGFLNGRFAPFLLSAPHPPVLILPGIAGTYGADVNDLGAWAFTRGIEPAGLQIDPLGHYYDDLIQTLDNSGYTRNLDLFAANYDWRMVPGPSDEVFDGVISGLSAASITDNVYEYGVDYLGHYLLAAMDAWETVHPGDTLKEVDLIAHSTGGLVARTYLQSAAYNGLLPDGRRLPTVRNLIMVGVPNRGASKVWNPIHDDWGVDISFQVVLSKMINLTFQKVLDGAVVTGPDYDIDLQSLLDCDEDLKTCFIRQYVPTLRSLLATYDFIDVGAGLVDVNHLPEQRNSLTLDLNAGLDLQLNGDPNSFAERCKATVIHATSEATPTQVVERQGPAGGENALVSFSEFTPRDALPDEVWYEDLIQPAGGDGTVPLISSREQFVGDARVTLSPYTLNGNTQEDVSHCGLMFNTQVQEQILTILGSSHTPQDISTGLHDAWATSFSTVVNVAANIVGGNILLAHLDPVEGFVVDGQGRRLGWSAATGAVAEIPGSRWFGNGDGLGWSYGALQEPVTLQLTGQGAEHYAQVSLATGWGQSGLNSSGPLGAGEVRTAAVPFPPLAAPLLSIDWTGPGQVTLSWSAVPGATGFQVSVAPAPDGPWTLLETSSATSTAVTVPDDGTRLLRVIAVR